MSLISTYLRPVDESDEINMYGVISCTYISDAANERTIVETVTIAIRDQINLVLHMHTVIPSVQANTLYYHPIILT